jgi:hypothetical protein
MQGSFKTASPNPLRRVADRERFLAFAFTAAELLVETDASGIIVFAAGTFQHRLGEPPEAWLGRPMQALFAPAERDGFNTVFALLAARGRLAPCTFHLTDAAATQVAVAGLMLPQPEGNSFCLTVAAMPVASLNSRADTGNLSQAAEARLRQAGGGASLGLLELAGPNGPITPRPELAARLGAALTEASGDNLSSELGAGR